MDYDAEINSEQNRIISLKQQIKNLTQPRKTISYQFQNMRFGNRNDAPRRMIVRREKLKINNQVASSQRRMVSLREALLGLKE